MKSLKFFIFSILITQCSLAQNIFRITCNGNLSRLDSMLTDQPVQIKDNQGRSLLHWAVGCKQKEIFDYLIKKGININSEDHHKKTPMHVAVHFSNEHYFELLYEMQPNNDWIAKYEGSLMEKAVMRKDTLFIKKLIKLGVNIDSKNERGSSGLEISQRMNSKEISKLLISLGADKNKVRTIEMTGKYMGQESPGSTPKLFAANFISTEAQEFSCCFNAEGTEFYFGVDMGGRNEIRYSKLIKGKWSKPKAIITHAKYSYNDPFLSNDENRLYFISTRALDGIGDTKDVDIWYVQKAKNGWSAPINVGPGINTSGNEYYISFTNEGTLYFSSNGHHPDQTKDGDHDIYYSEYVDGAFQKAVTLGDSINTDDYEGDVFIAPDESYIIFCSTRADSFGQGDLYISFKSPDGSWSKAVNMGKDINTSNYEYCPIVTKDGKYLFYTSNQDIYWVSTKIIEKIRPQ